MDRMRRIAGMGKAKVPLRSAVQKDKDESVVFFRELHKREKDGDVNLLEPMYSVEFDAIQGVNASKVPSGKRDFLIPVDEKHDYDWLMTPPAAPLFPSLEVEANSSQMVFQKELPVAIPPRQVKPSALKLSGKPDAAKTSARSTSPASNSSSRKTPVKGTPAISKEKNQHYTAEQRSSHKVRMNGQQKAAAAATSAAQSSGPPKKHSERCYTSQTGGTSAVNGVADQEFLYKVPKNLITTGSIFRRRTPPAEKTQSKDAGSGVDVKKENGKGRRNLLQPRGKSVAGSCGEAASNNNGRAGKPTVMKVTRSWM